LLLSPCMLVVASFSLLVWRIWIWGDGFGMVFGGFRQFGALSGGL
jgi:hypothetical protein